MRTDLISIPTMDYGRHILCLPYSILLIILLVLSSTDTIYSQISCIGQVRVSLDSRGQAQLDPSMFVRGDVTGHTVTVVDSRLADPTIVDCSSLNMDVSVMVTNPDGARCWSNLIVEDKISFDFTIRDTSILCTNQVENNSLLDLINIVDNCISAEDFTISFNTVRDSIFQSNSDTIRRDLRIWSITDPNGNSEVVTSFIYITRLDAGLISFPVDTIVNSMMNASNTIITGVPTVGGTIIPELCNLNVVTSIEGPFLLDCDKRLKYNRTWTIVDVQNWEIVAEDIQTIRFIDTTIERIIAPDLSLELGENCTAELEILNFEVTSEGIGMIPDQYKSITANGSVVFPGDRLTLSNQDTVILVYSATNDCLDPLDAISDTIIVSVPNSISIDNCNSHAVALSLDDRDNWMLSVDRLFAGKVASCNDYILVAARTEVICSPQDTVFSSEVNFCTDDIGTTVSIRVTAMDMIGGVSSDTCEILVQIQDNRIPQVECLLSSDTVFYSMSDTMAQIGDLNRFFNFENSHNILAITGSGTSRVGTGSGFSFSASFDSFRTFVEPAIGLDSFDCSFINPQGSGEYILDLMVVADNNTSVTCPVNLTLLDTLSLCQQPSAFLSGEILAYGMSGLNDAVVSIGNDSGIVSWKTTDSRGEFTFKSESDASQLSVERSDSWYLNITSNDLHLLEEILLGAYEPNLLEEASADLNNDGVVNTFDFITMKRLLLGEEPSLIFERSPWNIYANELACITADQCGNGSFTLSNFEDFNDIELWAVKEGDIDQDSAMPGESRNLESLNYVVEEKPGEQLVKQSIIIKTSEVFGISSFQIDLAIPGDTQIRIDETPGLIYKRYGNKLRLIYTQGSENSCDDIQIDLYEFLHEPKGFGILQTENDFESLIFINGIKNRVKLNRVDSPIAEEEHKAEAMIYPNPSVTQSRLRLDQTWPSGQVNFQIFNEIGKLVWSKTIMKNADYTEAILLPTDLNAGIYSVIIDSEPERLIKKYIKM